MKNIRLTVWIGMMCGCLAAGMLQAGTRPDNACPAEEDGSRLWLVRKWKLYIKEKCHPP